MNQIRVRFAPSPTGWLHIGGVRTALFNYLFAKKHGGKFLVRIEDTDTERSEKKYTQDILSCLDWLGMKSDEEVLYQSARGEHYVEIANQLVEQGFAYRCYSTPEEVEEMRKKATAEGRKPMYDRHWRDSSETPPDRPYAIRAKMPLTGLVSFQDLIRGEISFPTSDLDDFVMIRSNGVPTYNFVVVVDDVEMNISHVIRGDDHINNTPKQVFLYGAMKRVVPLFAHLPMILGEDKKKLSKRTGETSANVYRQEGYLPDALLNFLVRLGWSHGDQEIFTREEMIRFFDFEHVQVNGAVFNKEKLLWTQGEHLRRFDGDQLSRLLTKEFSNTLSEKARGRLTSQIGMALIAFVQGKVKLLSELVTQLQPLLEDHPGEIDWTGLKIRKDPELKIRTFEAIQCLKKEIDSRAVEHGASKRAAEETRLWGTSPSLMELGYHHADIDQLLRAYAERFGIKLSDLTQPLRVAVTARTTSSIGLFDLLPVLPWELLAARMTRLLDEGAIGS
jgi:glutamyl-tRNA synthetase